MTPVPRPVRRKMRLKLIVHLVRKETMEREYERLPAEPKLALQLAYALDVLRGLSVLSGPN